MTAAEIRDKVNAKLTILWPILVARQDAYYLVHSRYWQGRRTHTADPADGDDVTADRLSDHPTDQAETWEGVSLGQLVLGDLPMALQMDVYQTPAGTWGWCAHCYVKIGAQVWMRSKGVGPEDRDRPWTRIDNLT